MLAYEFALHVASGKKLEQSGDHADQYAAFNEDAAVDLMAIGEQIECADGGHDEAAGLHRAQHGVCVLPHGPAVHE